MSDVFELDTDGRTSMDQFARANPIRPEEVNAGAFQGMIQGTGEGLMRGGARTAQFVGLAAAAPLVLYEDATDQEGRFTDPYFHALDEYTTSAVDYWTPGPAEVGKVGQILGGLAEIALPLMAGGGNPALLIGAQTTGPAIDLVREGVDADTAASVGLIQGAATAAGFRIPMLGRTLTQRLAAGVAGNLAVNVPAAAAQRAVLEATGEPEAAQRFNPLDLEARALDVLTGLAFGGIAHGQLRTADREAIAAANNAKHFQSDTAPGTPRDVASSVAHQLAMEQATEQLLNGEPVSVPPEIATAEFEPRPPRDPPEKELERLAETLPENEVVEPVFPLTATPGFKQFFSDSKVVDESGAPLVVYHGTRDDFTSFDTSQLGKTTGAPSAAKGFFFANRPATASGYTDLARVEEKELHDDLFKQAEKLRSNAFRTRKNKEAQAAKFAESDRLYKEAREMRTAGGQVMPVYLSLKNPLIYAMQGKVYRDQSYSDLIDQAKAAGHDGLIIKNTFDQVLTDEKLDDIYVAFDARQVKSAIGNSGRFDPQATNLADTATRAEQPSEGTLVEQPPPTQDTPIAAPIDEPSREPTPRDEQAEDSVEPGTPFLVFRAAERRALENANAGNAKAAGTYLMKLDQEGRIKEGDTISVYLVTHQDGFAGFTRYADGQPLTKDMSHGRVGRRATDQGIVYSFRDGGKFDAEKRLEIPIAELRQAIKAEGYSSFGDAESDVVAAALRRITETKLAKAPDSDQAIEARFREQLTQNPEATEAAYARLKDSEGGKVLNVDTARELSPDYLKDRTRSAAVHEPASEFIKELYAKKLAEAPKAGEAPLVLFTAGGAGAGKSTAVETALGTIAKTAQIVYDTNMNNLASSVKKIEQALAAGKDVNIVYVYRDPREALKSGALPRAMRQEAKFGSGRTVPMKAFLDTHVGAREVVTQLAERYAGDPRIDIQAIDNSGGLNGARSVMLSEVPKFQGDVYTQLRGQANDILEAERAAGRISESVYRGFKDTDGSPEADGKAARSAARSGARGEPEPQRPQADGRGSQEPGAERLAADLDPELRAARELLSLRDVDIPTGETGPNGEILTRSARELLADADAAVERAKADAAAYDAAAACFLRGDAP